MDSKLYYVKHQLDQGVATVTFYNPKANSFSSVQLKSLEKQIHELGDNDKVKVIVLKSEGDEVFSSGAYFEEMLHLKNRDDAKNFFFGFAKVILAMRDCPKFIVGAIEGKAVGGGVGLAAACDYTFATENASIKLSELSVGIGPFVIEPALRRRIGLNATTELTLNPSDWKTAAWAKEKGLYSRVYPDQEALQQGLELFCEQLKMFSALAMKDLKSIFWEGTQDWKNLMSKRAEMSGNLVLSEEAKSILHNLTHK